ncbi:quinone oxidoreductase [Halobacillus halophilus]|uniref:NAD(P)H:quinone oxidoreductase n=1 Tax=Halobacillus halophilus (strain ATCC 35676 / DSM 2266 / JCM 20832 / KCTC 3685 / LMG 17431 / NBRC 102448 / NCIMB 2269) TaxID=866895 RepID=I0JJ53_HALH3|nr:quinone oxidoreductase [Halobacillus halophilus]ASF38334.1 quinone oxidoreductase [Halobacillus halophilus]CCG44171.1 NAD(P)H:quinone oxidoreductase [Halobacillus halophilus DSM 2266]
MKAIQFKEYGGPEVLESVQVEDPALGEGEVKIKVTAIGVNYADTARREGAYVVPTPLPFIPGAEVAGVVEQTGKGADQFKKGDRVVTLIGSGGYAEYVVTKESNLIPVPEELDDENAVAIPLQGLTAYHLLTTMGRLEKGETVLIHAAAGGVGSLAVQLAKHYGAEVIATASSEEKLNLAKELGADHTVNYTNPNWRDEVMEATDGRGVDIALEMAGGDIFHETVKCMRSFGRLVVYGVASGNPPQMYPSGLMNRNLSVIGFFLPQIMKKPVLFEKSLKELLKLVNTGELKLTVGGVYNLDEAAHVHEILQARKTKGKLVLKP